MDGNVIAHTATTTTTKHVVSKLTGLVEMEWCKLSSLRDDIDYMREELRSMHALLARLGAADDDDEAASLAGLGAQSFRGMTWDGSARGRRRHFTYYWLAARVSSDGLVSGAVQ